MTKQGIDRNKPGRRSWQWKILLSLVALLLACLVASALVINPVALSQINRLINTCFTEGGRLEAVKLSLLTGHVELTGVTINPPRDYSADQLLTLRELILDIVPSSVFDDTIVVEELVVKGLSINLVRDSQGRYGLSDLIKTDKPNDEKTTTDEQPDAKVTTDASSRESSLPTIQINKIRFEDGSLILRDNALADQPLVFRLENIQVLINQLNLFARDDSAPPTTLKITSELEQPEPLPKAYFGAVAKIGPIAGDVPATNAHVRLIGLNLDTLGTMIPPATRDALGGDGLDFGMVLVLNKERINLNALILTDQNIRYDTIQVKGPLEAPVVDIAPFMTGMFRVTDGVLNVGEKGLGAGIRLAGGGINVAQGVVSGVWKAGKRFVSGLFDVGAGLVTLDGERTQEGLFGSTVDTIELSLDVAKKNASTTSTELDESASVLSGKEAANAWDQGIPGRFQADMDSAQKALEEMPYPPSP